MGGSSGSYSSSSSARVMAAPIPSMKRLENHSCRRSVVAWPAIPSAARQSSTKWQMLSSRAAFCMRIWKCGAAPRPPARPWWGVVVGAGAAQPPHLSPGVAVFLIAVSFFHSHLFFYERLRKHTTTQPTAWVAALERRGCRARVHLTALGRDTRMLADGLEGLACGMAAMARRTDDE